MSHLERRLRALETGHAERLARCEHCARRPDCFICWPGDPVAERASLRCIGCGWVPTLIEVLYHESPLQPADLPRGPTWLT